MLVPARQQENEENFIEHTCQWMNMDILGIFKSPRWVTLCTCDVSAGATAGAAFVFAFTQKLFELGTLNQT